MNTNTRNNTTQYGNPNTNTRNNTTYYGNTNANTSNNTAQHGQCRNRLGGARRCLLGLTKNGNNPRLKKKNHFYESNNINTNIQYY